MKRSKKLICILAVLVLFIIALPTGVYAYNYNQYKANFNKAVLQLGDEKYDESINSFNDISNTYFGKKDAGEIKKEIQRAKEFKENKKVYDEALKLFTDKKYLEALEGFKKIPVNDTKRYGMAVKNIDECKSLYISVNLENARNEAKSNNYDSAINYLSLVLTVDTSNTDAITLKDEYTKAKEAADLKAKQEAEAKAKQEAEAKAKQEAEQRAKKEAAAKTIRIPSIVQPQTAYVPTQVSGMAAIKGEFQKMGFVFQSDTKATYTKNGMNVDLEYIADGGEKGSCWAVYTSSLYYGGNEEQLYTNAMTIILGRDKASYNLTYIHYALATSDSYETPNIKTRIYDQKLYVFIYMPK